MIAFSIVLLFLATGRLTLFITRDDLFEDRIRRDILESRKLYKLNDFTKCPWCVSFWVGVVLTIVWWLLPPQPFVLLTLPLSLSYVVSYVQQAMEVVLDEE